MEEEERQEEPSRYPLQDYGCPELQEVMRRTAGRLGHEGWCAGGWPDEELEPAETLAAAGFRAAVRWVESNSHSINLDDKVLDHRSRAKSEMKPTYVSYACLLAAFIHCGYVDPDNVCITSSDGRRIGTKWFEGVAADVLLKVSATAEPLPPSFRNCTPRDICAAAEEGSADALAILCAQPHVLVRKGPSEYVSGSALARWKDPGTGRFNLMDLSVRANTTTGEEEERRCKLVKVLLTHGYELNTEDDSSLHEAAKLGLCTIIACLLDNGANPLIVRPLGGVPQSAIEVARRQGQRQACELLERGVRAEHQQAAVVALQKDHHERRIFAQLRLGSPPMDYTQRLSDQLLAYGPAPSTLPPSMVGTAAYQQLCWLRDGLTRIAPGLALVWTLIPAESSLIPSSPSFGLSSLLFLNPLATHNGVNSNVFTARYDDKKVFVKRVPNGEDAVREVYKLVHRQRQEDCGQYFSAMNSQVPRLMGISLSAENALQIVTESLSGTLHDWIEKMRGEIDDQIFRQLLVRGFRKVAEELAHMHEKNEAHFDVKPKNIFLEYDTPAAVSSGCLGDFGSSAAASECRRMYEATALPEEEKDDPGIRSDTFLFGMCVWCAASGGSFADAPSAERIAAAREDWSGYRLRALKEVVLPCVDGSPGERPCMSRVADLLDRWLMGLDW